MDLNQAILTGNLGFRQILGVTAKKVEKRLAFSMESSGGSLADSGGLGESGQDLGVSGFYEEEDGRNFALTEEQLGELRIHVSEAQDVLGEDKVSIVDELGSVKLTLNVYEFMEKSIAEKLGFSVEEPIFLSFCYEKSPIPSVSCTQRVDPGYAVKNHLKSIVDYFFSLWNKDRETLMEVGRPPQGIGTADPLGNNNNNAAPLHEEVQRWWKNANVVASLPKQQSQGKSISSDKKKVVISDEKLTQVMELGFDSLAACEALLKSNADVDKATMLLLSGAKKSSPDHLKSVDKLVSMGFPKALACAALIKHKHNVQSASESCLDPERVWEAESEVEKKSLLKGIFGKKEPKKEDKEVKKGAKVEKAEKLKDIKEQHPYSKDNVIFGLLDYLEMRLSRYGSFCISCQAPHSCSFVDGGVVCSESLCVFQLEESPMEKMLSVHLCPFEDCKNLDLSTVGKEFMGIPLDKICRDYGLTSQQLLEMLLHRYLPTEQIKRLLEDGLRTTHAKSVESVLNPALCARFERAWKDLREQRPDMKVIC